MYIQWERFFELAPKKVTRGHIYKLFKKRKGTLGQKFFSARVVDLWNALDDSTVSRAVKKGGEAGKNSRAPRSHGGPELWCVKCLQYRLL